MIKILLIFFLISFIDIQVSGENKNYFCTEESWKCILRGFESADELKEFCNQIIKLDYLSYEGQTLQGSTNQFSIVEFQNSSVTSIPLICPQIFYNLQIFTASHTGIENFGQIMFEYLKTLDMSWNNISELRESNFVYLHKVEEIDLSHNLIEIIQPNAFSQMSRSIKIINLSYNRITQFDEFSLIIALNNFWNLNFLDVTFQLDHNKIEEFIPVLRTCDLRHNKKNIKVTVDLSYNVLKTIQSKCNISELNLSNNQLEKIETNAEKIIADDNNIKSVKFLNNPQSLSLRNNNLHLLDDYVSFLSTLSNVMELDLSNNSFETFKLDSFADMKYLKKLSIRNVGLSKIPFGLFGHLKRLTHLDLSYNLLNRFDSDKYLALDNLEFLDLSGNKFSNLDYVGGIKTILPKLQRIGLEGNSWHCNFLSKIKISLNVNRIELIEAVHPVKNVSNIFGIKCF